MDEPRPAEWIAGTPMPGANALTIKVLVPLDGTEESERVLPLLLPLIQARRVIPDLITVVDSGLEGVKQKYYLENLRTRLSDAGFQCKVDVESGEPAETITQAARERKCDLIALSTRGGDGRFQLEPGSVSEKILKTIEIPVLFTRPESKVKDWKRITVVLDGSPLAESILPDALGLARAIEATVHLLRIEAPGTPSPAADRYLDELSRRLAKTGESFLPVSRSGSVVQEILSYAESADVGLLCLTAKGMGKAAEGFAGRVASEIVRHAPCPVLLRGRNALPESSG